MPIFAIFSPAAVEIAVRSPRRATTFYSLIFERIPDFSDLDSGLVIYRLGSKKIQLHRVEKGGGKFFPSDTRIRLLVEDLAYECQRVQQIPFAQIADLQELTDHSFRLVILDPDGNSLELHSTTQAAISRGHSAGRISRADRVKP